MTYIRRHIEEHFPVYRTLLLEHAERAYNQQFQFSMPWDMEATWVAHHFSGSMDWEFQMGEDPEWTFMLSRSAFVLHLVQGSILTGKESWAQKAQWYIDDFMRQVPHDTTLEQTCWRSLDASMRLMNWIDAMTLLDKVRCPRFLQAIRMHVDYLATKENLFLLHSNWGIIGNAGLYKGSLLLEDYAFAALAEARIVESLAVQVHADGMHWEQSPLYHGEVLSALLVVIKAAKDHRRQLQPNITDAARRMGRFLLGSIKPNRHHFQQSDSDDTEVRDLLTRCSFLLDDSALWPGCYDELEYTSAFFATKEEIDEFRVRRRNPPPFVSFAALQSGNVYLRSGWEKDATCCHLRSGPLGSGHGHADLLHIDVVAHGQDVLVDSGRYTYCESEERLTLKGERSHSTILVDDQETTLCTGTWSYARKALSGPRGFDQVGDWAWTNAMHFGYLAEGGKAVVLEREVLLLGRDYVVIHDTLLAIGSHEYTWHFHFSPSMEVRLHEGRVVCESDALRSTLYIPAFKAEMFTTPFSLHYNQLQTKQTLRLKDNATGLHSALFVLHTTASDAPDRCTVKEIPLFFARRGERCLAHQGRAWEIRNGEEEPIQLIFRYRECFDGVDLLTTGKVRSYGRTVVHQQNRTEIFKS